MTSRERWLQRVLHARGVRPVGHADPAEDQGDPTAPLAPVVPVRPMPPAPGWPPAGTRTARISTTSAAGTLPPPGRTRPPDWVVAAFEEADRKEAEERKAAEAREAANAADEEDQAAEGVVDDEVRDQEDEAPAPPLAAAEPVVKVPAGAKPVRKRLPGSGWFGGAGKSGEDDPAPRIAAFNLTAAAVGYGTPLAGIVDTYLVHAEQAARGVFGFVLAVAGALGTWWVTGRPAVREILGCLPYWGLIRLAACFGLAEMAHRMAPVPVAWLNENGQEWGLGPNAVSLLITSGGICFTLWWFIDRQLRRFHWSVRWVFRIPLATAAVVTLRYGNPIH